MNGNSNTGQITLLIELNQSKIEMILSLELLIKYMSWYLGLQPSYWGYIIRSFAFFAVTVIVGYLLSQVLGIFGWIIGAITGIVIANIIDNYMSLRYGSDRDKLQHQMAKQNKHDQFTNMEMDISKCPSCMQSINADDNHCSNCGFDLSRIQH